MHDRGIISEINKRMSWLQSELDLEDSYNGPIVNREMYFARKQELESLRDLLKPYNNLIGVKLYAAILGDEALNNIKSDITSYDLIAERHRNYKQSFNWKPDTRSMVSYLIEADKIDIFASEEHSYYIAVMEYDFFGRGYTAYHELNEDELEQLYHFVMYHEDTGVEAWLCYYHRKLPRPAIVASLKPHWDVEALTNGKLPENLK